MCASFLANGSGRGRRGRLEGSLNCFLKLVVQQAENRDSQATNKEETASS